MVIKRSIGCSQWFILFYIFRILLVTNNFCKKINPIVFCWFTEDFRIFSFIENQVVEVISWNYFCIHISNRIKIIQNYQIIKIIISMLSSLLDTFLWFIGFWYVLCFVLNWDLFLPRIASNVKCLVCDKDEMLACLGCLTEKILRGL